MKTRKIIVLLTLMAVMTTKMYANDAYERIVKSRDQLVESKHVMVKKKHHTQMIGYVFKYVLKSDEIGDSCFLPADIKRLVASMDEVMASSTEAYSYNADNKDQSPVAMFQCVRPDNFTENVSFIYSVKDKQNFRFVTLQPSADKHHSFLLLWERSDFTDMHGKAFASIDGYVIELTGNEWRINKLSGNAYASDSKNNYKAYDYIENNDTTSFVKLREKMKYVASQYANYARQGNIEEMTGMAYLARQLATNYDKKLTVAQNESIMEIVKSIGAKANHTIGTLLNKTREELDKKTDKNSSGEKLISRNYRQYYKMHLRETDSKNLLEYFKPVSAKNIDWRLGGTTHPDHRFVRIAHMFHRNYKFRYDDGKITFSKSLPAGSAVCVSDGTVNGEWILLVDSVPVDIDMATGELRRGSELNKRFIAYQKRMAQYENEVAKHVNFFYNNHIVMNEGGYAAIYDSIIAYNYSVMMNNLGNGIAEYILYDNYPSFSFSQLDAAFRSNKINTASPLVQPAYNYYIGKKKRQPGMMYPDVNLKGTDGKTHKLSDYVGKSKFVVIHFWSINSWFSRRAMSANKNIAKNYDADKIKVIGISLQDSENTWQNYIQSRRMTWTQLYAGSMESDAARAYGVTAMPETVIIDSEGRIVVEGLHGKDLELKIAELLGE